MSTAAPTRACNTLIARSFDWIARPYDFAPLQWLVYRPPHDEVLAELRAAGACRIADIGCGTGILTSRIERELRPERIVGVDASAGMLARARRRSERVGWYRGPAERLPFADADLDAVVCTTAFHFFDQPAALAEFARVLVPGGVMIVSTVGSLSLPRLARISMFPAHAPTPAELRKMVQALGFDVLDQRPIHRPLPRPLIPDIVTVARRP
ncbi:class I SAM-dependent methyltransferase [Nocardia terpenica]|uniref:Methyltransferase domain-containing protein n=1 Tax=Nocardia terpenica TaxID=455432 RepID=A0A6G9Z7R8_9NOCA|nr:class I SAM-dependent methyltransferase [Nocardia terpenica]QIS21470.1 methyltransferase domain-containing protein [Nocardia terpenica]